MDCTNDRSNPSLPVFIDATGEAYYQQSQVGKKLVKGVKHRFPNLSIRHATPEELPILTRLGMRVGNQGGKQGMTLLKVNEVHDRLKQQRIEKYMPVLKERTPSNELPFGTRSRTVAPTSKRSNKPPYSTVRLIGQALLNSQNIGLAISEIVEWISNTYPYYQRVECRARVSNALSRFKFFEKSSKHPSLWQIVQRYEDEFRRNAYIPENVRMKEPKKKRHSRGALQIEQEHLEPGVSAVNRATPKKARPKVLNSNSSVSARVEMNCFIDVMGEVYYQRNQMERKLKIDVRNHQNFFVRHASPEELPILRSMGVQSYCYSGGKPVVTLVRVNEVDDLLTQKGLSVPPKKLFFMRTGLEGSNLPLKKTVGLNEPRPLSTVLSLNETDGSSKAIGRGTSATTVEPAQPEIIFVEDEASETPAESPEVKILPENVLSDNCTIKKAIRTTGEHERQPAQAETFKIGVEQEHRHLGVSVVNRATSQKTRSKLLNYSISSVSSHVEMDCYVDISGEAYYQRKDVEKKLKIDMKRQNLFHRHASPEELPILESLGLKSNYYSKGQQVLSLVRINEVDDLLKQKGLCIPLKKFFCMRTGSETVRHPLSGSNVPLNKTVGLNEPRPFTTVQSLNKIVGSSKPPFSTVKLISQALLSSQNGGLTSREIVEWISKTYPYYQSVDCAKRVSVTLSTSKFFGKQSKSSRTHIWQIVRKYEAQVEKHAYTSEKVRLKEKRKRKKPATGETCATTVAEPARPEITFVDEAASETPAESPEIKILPVNVLSDECGTPYPTKKAIRTTGEHERQPAQAQTFKIEAEQEHSHPVITPVDAFAPPKTEPEILDIIDLVEDDDENKFKDQSISFIQTSESTINPTTPSVTIDPIDPGVGSTVSQCPICDAKFPSKQALGEHVVSHKRGPAEATEIAREALQNLTSSLIGGNREQPIFVFSGNVYFTPNPSTKS